jgi:hypothetical protein
MPFLGLPPELRLWIARQLETEKDIYSLMKTNSGNYWLFLSLLYKRNVDFSSGSALIWCLDHENDGGVRLLLELGASVEQGQAFLRCASSLLQYWIGGPLHFARNVDMVKLLLDNGVDVNHSPGGSAIPLHFAVDRGNLAVTKLLLDNKADVNRPARHGVTPLHVAANNGNMALAKLLVDYGADVNGYDTSRSLFGSLGNSSTLCPLDQW